MNSGHGRAPSGAYATTLDDGEPWEKLVVLGLMKVCLRDSVGQSSIDALRDALIDNWPHVLPEMKHRYGKFTSFLKVYDRYFQINPYDRTVRLISLHPDLSVPSSSRNDRYSHSSMPETSNAGSYGYINASSSSISSMDSSRTASTSSVNIPSSSSTGSRARSSYHAPQPTNTMGDMAGSPRGHSMAHRPTQSLSSFAPNSAQSSNLHASTSYAGSTSTATAAPTKHVSFSSLEQWEQMIIFAVLKYLLSTPSGLEHCTVLQDRLNDSQLTAKYATILDLLKLFPGNFSIDSKGYVSLMDPVKARAQYPVLAAEFERRLSTPQQPVQQEPQSQLYVAFNNATSPWEKALLKTVWSVLMTQTNHAANFPWLTTQLTRFKPWVKQNFGSLRLWAIQQTLFKFQGDTIYIPAHIAPSAPATAPISAATGVPAPPAPPTARAPHTSSSSTFASVNSANFSIPAPPALPTRRTNSSGIAPIPPPPPMMGGPKSLASYPPAPGVGSSGQMFGMPYAADDANIRRGRQSTASSNSSVPGHKRQRSASPTSIRQAYGSGHSRSSSVTDDFHLPIHSRQISTSTSSAPMGYPNPASPPSQPHNNNVVPRLNFQGSSSSSSTASSSTAHHFTRKVSSSLENSRPGYLETNAANVHREGVPHQAVVINGPQPTSPRRASVGNPLASLDKEIPSLPGVALTINRTPVPVKAITDVEELRKMVSFLSTFSVISISAEIGEVESVSRKRRTNFSQEYTPEDLSTSPGSVRILSSPGRSPGDSSLIIGSAPSQLSANPLDSLSARDEVSTVSQDDMAMKQKTSRPLNRHSTTRISSTLDEVPIIHEDREEEYGSEATKDILIMCFTAKTNHGQSPYAPSSTMAAHMDKEVLRSHPVFVVELRDNPKFYRFLRPLLQSHSTLKIVHNCPRLSDVLYTQHGIHLANILEIQVLHRLLWEISTLPQRFTHATGLETLSSLDDIARERERDASSTPHSKSDGHHHHATNAGGNAGSSGYGSGHSNHMSSAQTSHSANNAHASRSDRTSTERERQLRTEMSGPYGESSNLSVASHARSHEITRSGDSSTSSRAPTTPSRSQLHSSGGGSGLKSPNGQQSSLGAHDRVSPSTSTTPRHGSSAPAQPQVPTLDAPFGRILQYFGVTFAGLSVPANHELFEAVEPNGNLAALRSLNASFSVSVSVLMRRVAACVSLIDLRILLATQLSVSFTKSAMLLSQGLSHTHLPEFQSVDLASDSHHRHHPSLTPLSHDHWMDAPELFSHLHEGHGSDI